MPSAPKKKLVKTTLYFPAEIHQALKLEAVRRKMTLTDVILEALESRSFMIKNAPEVSL